jgi:hypothetical protein
MFLPPETSARRSSFLGSCMVKQYPALLAEIPSGKAEIRLQI